jgi:hypothetical protein
MRTKFSFLTDVTVLFFLPAVSPCWAGNDDATVCNNVTDADGTRLCRYAGTCGETTCKPEDTCCPLSVPQACNAEDSCVWETYCNLRYGRTCVVSLFVFKQGVGVDDVSPRFGRPASSVSIVVVAVAAWSLIALPRDGRSTVAAFGRL